MKNNLKIIRERKGISRRWLSTKTGIKYATLRQYETGAVRITGESLLKLAKVLNVPPEDILSPLSRKEETAC